MPEPCNVCSNTKVPTGYGVLLGDKEYVTFPLFMEVVPFKMTNTLWPIPGYHRVSYATDSGYQIQKYNFYILLQQFGRMWSDYFFRYA